MPLDKERTKIVVWDDWDEGWGPQEISSQDLKEPKLSVVEIGDGENKHRAVAINYFGRAEGLTSRRFQFRFLLTGDPDRIDWFGHPEWFRVAFLGQVKDWPNPEAAQEIADKITGGKLEGWLAWVVSGKIGLDHGSGTQIASYATPVILFVHPHLGLITPEPFVNMEAVEEESSRLQLR